MSTVSTAEEDYRGYRLQAVRIFSDWQCSIYPTTTDQLVPALAEIIAAPTLDEVFGKARWWVDRMLDRR